MLAAEIEHDAPTLDANVIIAQGVRPKLLFCLVYSGLPTRASERSISRTATEHNPRQWPDGTYSVQGAAEALSISAQTVFKWLQKGRLSGHHRLSTNSCERELNGRSVIRVGRRSGIIDRICFQ
jgi:hypothetical protein